MNRSHQPPIIPLCNDEQRLAALHEYGILDTPAEQGFDDITRLTALVCQAPVAAINFIDRGRQWFKSEIGLGVSEMPLDASICANILSERDLCVVPDLTRDARFAQNALVVREPHLRFYAGEVLRSPQGHPLGTLCVLDYQPRDLSETQRSAMRSLARQVMSQLELRRSLVSQTELLSDRRRAQEAAGISERRFTKLVEQSPLSTQFFAPDGRVRATNRAWERLFGLTIAEIPDYNILEDQQLVERGLMPLIQRGFAGEPTQLPAIPYVPHVGVYQGQERWCSAFIYPVRDDAGTIAEVVLVHHDLTDQNRAEQAVREREAQLNAVVENMTEGLILSDAQGNLLSMNPAALAIHQIASEAEMLRKLEQYPDLFILCDLDGNTLRLEDWPLSRAIRGERFNGYEVHVTRTDTGKSWIGSYGGTPIHNSAGMVELVVLTLSDVTAKRRAEEELRESEARLRLGLEAGNTGTWDWDIPTNTVRWSEQVYQFHGLKPGEFGGTVEAFAKLIHPDDAQWVNDAIQKSIRDHTPYVVEFRVVHPNGAVRWIATRGTVYYAPDGAPLRMLGATSDVTDRKRGEQLLDEQKIVLEMIAAGAPLREILAAITRLVERQSSGDLCSILRLDGRTQRLHLGAAPSLPDAYNAAIEGVRIGENVGSCGTAAHRRERVVVTDIENDPLWANYKSVALEHGLRACWSQPILAQDGRILGTVANYCREAGGPNEQHLQLLEAATHLAGIAIEREQAASDAQTLYEVGLAMSGETDVHKLVQAITDAGTNLSRAQFGAFFYNVVKDDGQAYMLYTISGVPREEFAKFPMPRATELFGPTFRGEGIIRLHDVTQDPRYGKSAPHHGMPAGHLPVRSFLSVPVKSRSGAVIGGLFFGHSQAGVFSEDAESVISNIAAQAGLVLDNADLLRQSRESEATFRQMANTIPQLAWMAKPDGYIFWYNDQWYRYTGSTPQEMEGWGWQRVHDPKFLPTVMEQWQASIRTGQPFDMEFPLRSAHGEFRSFLTRVNPLRGDDGKIILWFGTNTDVSEWRRQQEALAASEARLRAVVQATPECVKIVKPDRSLLYMNPVGLSMIEADTFESVNAAAVDELVTTEHRQQWREFHQRVCAGETLSWEFEIIGRRNTRRWMETHAVPLPLPDGQTAQLSVTRDITQRKHAERERETLLESERAARAEAERVSRMKDEFLATLSHELRTPLNAILGWSQILRTSSSNADDLAEGLSTIERNARTQAQIIEDLLDMSRIISGKVRLDVQRTDLVAILEAAIQTARPASEAKEIRVHAVLDPLAGPVSGDPNRLQQVFWNLLSNAVKFTPRGGRIQVLLERVNSHLEISVIDSGEGIPPDFLPYVFDRFRQADASTTRRHGGLGLGLAIAKQLIELHGGTIRAKSAGSGQGSTFIISLPLTILHPGSAADVERRHPTAASVAPNIEPCLDLDGVRVLVVDDEPDARALVQRLLVDCKAKVTTVGSADEATRHLQSDTFDVLVSDVGMPTEDGYSLIRRVRKLKHGAAAIPALALTAYARSEDRQKAIIAGFDLHVAKPVEPSELITMVSSLARRRSNLRSH
ncbi:hypothetical protein BH09PLA1_BH09PLA1_09090 [soil metagenome]